MEPNLVSPEIPQPVTPLQAPTSKLEFLLYLLLIVTTICASLIFYFRYWNREPNSISSNTNQITPKPTPTPSSLHPGKGIFKVSHSKSTGPTISQVIFDPLNIDNGEDLHLQVSINNNLSIKSVVGSLASDNKTTPISFTPVANATGSSQVWETTVNPNDTVLYTYSVSITAENSTGNTIIIVSPR